MRDDLLDAQAAIDWAVTHIECVQDRFEAYVRRRPYDVVMEDDPNGTGEKLLVAYSLGDPDLLLNAAVGAILNSLRSSLDLLFFSLVRRNGKEPSRYARFPIRESRADFLSADKSFKKEQWLTQAQRATIESLRPYNGGDPALYNLHHLDIIRKHRRLVEIRPAPDSVRLPFIVAHSAIWGYFDDKTVLLRFPPGADIAITKDNCEISLQISFYEPSLGLSHAPVVRVLRHLAEVTTGIIKTFDTPD
jgi:hypothetical protein